MLQKVNLCESLPLTVEILTELLSVLHNLMALPNLIVFPRRAGTGCTSGSFSDTHAHNTDGLFMRSYGQTCSLHPSTDLIADTWAEKEIAAKFEGHFENFSLLEDLDTNSALFQPSHSISRCYLYFATGLCDAPGGGDDGGGLYEGDGCWRWHLSPHGTCQCLCWHVRSDGEQDLWQAAFKNLPLGNTASLTSLLKAHTWPASRRREGEFSISLPPPPPFPSTSIYPPLSLEYYAKSALFSHLPLTYQMHARQPLFNTEQEKWRAGWQSVAIRMDTWWLMLLLLSLSPPKTLHIFQSNKLKHWSSIAEFGTSSFSPKTIQFTVKHQSG